MLLCFLSVGLCLQFLPGKRIIRTSDRRQNELKDVKELKATRYAFAAICENGRLGGAESVTLFQKHFKKQFVVSNHQ